MAFEEFSRRKLIRKGPEPGAEPMPQEAAKQPLGGRLILRRKLSPRTADNGASKGLSRVPRGIVGAIPKALQQEALQYGGLVTEEAWISCAVTTLCGVLYPARFDQVKPWDTFFEVEGEPTLTLHAYKKETGEGGRGLASYLGVASNLRPGRVEDRDHLFRNFELVYVNEDAARELAGRTGFLGALNLSLTMYRDRPDEAWMQYHLRDVRRTSPF